MQPIRPPAAKAFDLTSIPPMAWAVKGQRAVVEFAPKPTSSERLVAGIVTKLESGEVSHACALDQRKMEHAFGDDGAAMYAIAEELCRSLGQHWQNTGAADSWVPPFGGARIAELTRFSGRTVEEAHATMLNRVSTFTTLLSTYDIADTKRPTSIVARVRSAVKRDVNAKHLTKRFNRELNLGDSAGPMRVDFLGQHYACYFLQITSSSRGLDLNTGLAFGKLYELDALQRFVKKPKNTLGLLEDERPSKFELVMVGNRSDSVQRRAIYQVEAIADKRSTRVQVMASANAAAEHVSDRERLAA